MTRHCRWVAAAAAMTLVPLTPAESSDAIAFFNQEQASAGPEMTGSISKSSLPTPHDSGRKRGGSVEKQIVGVSTGCLKPELMRLVRDASSSFGAPAIITSGYRPGRGSFHGRCMAADVQIAGVGPGALARFFRAQPGVGGVGTYGHTRSVHVDVAPRRFTWHHGRRKRYAALGCPCCGGRSLLSCKPESAFATIRLGAARA